MKAEVETLIEETLAEYDIERIIEDAFSENNMKIIIESDGEVIELGTDELSEELRMELDDIDSQKRNGMGRAPYHGDRGGGIGSPGYGSPDRKCRWKWCPCH